LFDTFLEFIFVGESFFDLKFQLLQLLHLSFNLLSLVVALQVLFQLLRLFIFLSVNQIMGTVALFSF
jgi:hypothetical protein